jgi:hypothetical protein
MRNIDHIEEKTRFGNPRTLSPNRSTKSRRSEYFWSDHHAALTFSA